MRKLLDCIFVNRKAAIVAPLITAAGLYLLFVLFGQGENKWNLVLLTPLVSAVCYGGTYFVFWVQLKNPSCPNWFLDFAELLCLAVFGLGSAYFILQFLVNMATGFVPTLCPGIMTWSAVALIDSKRNQ